MFQPDLFTNQINRTNTFLDSGYYSTAYKTTDGSVVKVGRNDMTRNWLEFCKAHHGAGTAHKLMPRVYKVVGLDEGMYMASMPFFTTFLAKHPEGAHPRLGLCSEMKYTTGFKKVEKAFMKYLESLGYEVDVDWTGNKTVFNDIHFGNVMYDGNQLVITDPCSDDYVKMTTKTPFKLAKN